MKLPLLDLESKIALAIKYFFIVSSYVQDKSNVSC